MREKKRLWVKLLKSMMMMMMTMITRKLSYRKDDRAMRPIYGCHENCPESLATPTATFPDIFNELLFRSILWMRLQNLKFVALSVPVIGLIRVPKNLGIQSLDTPGYAHAPFSTKFFIGFGSNGPSAKFEVRSFILPEIIVLSTENYSNS